jgi:undecaprenyl-diphosphatase
MKLLRRWLEPGLLLLVFAGTSALWLFLKLADEVAEGETGAIDRAILLALHPANGPDAAQGPRWLWEVARDITGLGSTAVLCLIVAATLGFLLLARRRRMALFVFAATSLAALANALLKLYYQRPRPDLIPHAMYLDSSSFPSGHAMLSATVYLTLGALLARLTTVGYLRLYILGVAALVSALVGISRVYLGVHWPSDVLAGWAAGAAWALGAWALAQRLHLGERAGQ